MTPFGADPVVGIIVNPRAGTDVRRLVAVAAPSSDLAKIGAIRQAVIGAVEGGATRIVVSDDRRALARRAIERLRRSGVDVVIELLPGSPFDSRSNTVVAAREMRERGVAVVIVLGGDGTHRDVVSGWRNAPLVAVSSGTNNVFPRPVDATLAGHAAGAVASGAVELDAVSWRAKVIDVTVDGRDERDVALVDVALLEGGHVGSRAVWDAGTIRELVATIAEPASVGLSSVAAAVAPCGRRDPGGVHVSLDSTAPRAVRAPIAPGHYASFGVRGHRCLAPGDVVALAGPGVLSIDGERDIVLPPGATATAVIAADGPHVVDVDAALAIARAYRDDPVLDDPAGGT